MSPTKKKTRLGRRLISAAESLALIACLSLGAWLLRAYKPPSPRGQALIRAVKQNDVAACRKLLSQGLDPNTEDVEPEQEASLTDAFHLGEHFLHPIRPQAALAVALAFERNPGWPTPNSREPVEIVNALLDHGANPRAVCANSEPVICRAACFGYAGCVRALLSHGASVHDRQSNGVNAMQQAISGNNLPTVQAIVEGGWKVNSQEVELADCYKNSALSEYLVQQEQANRGKSARDIAPR